MNFFRGLPMSATKPATREELKQYCLRRLGAPLLEINVADEQLEDCIEMSLQYYHDYHFDGVQKVFLAHQVTETDVENKYIDIPQEIIGVVNIFDIGTSFGTNNLFNLRYQIALNDLYAFSTGPFAPYYMALQNVALAQELFVGKQGLRYNRHQNKLFIDMAWKEKLSLGEYIVVEAYQIIDPEVYNDVWNDMWLKRYTTAQFKKQWGENLKKFDGLQMPGALTFNGQKIWDEAIDEITKLEEEMLNSYSLPVSDMIG
jgi:hypothetical protein